LKVAQQHQYFYFLKTLSQFFNSFKKKFNILISNWVEKKILFVNIVMMLQEQYNLYNLKQYFSTEQN